MNILFSIANSLQMYKMGKGTKFTGLFGIALTLGFVYICWSHWGAIAKWIHTSDFMAPVIRQAGNASTLSIFVALLLTGFVLIVISPIIVYGFWIAIMVFFAVIYVAGSVLASIIIDLFHIKPKQVKSK